MSSQIKVRATRSFTLNDVARRKGEIFAMPTDLFQSHGPSGTGLVEAYSPPAPVAAAPKPRVTSRSKKP